MVLVGWQVHTFQSLGKVQWNLSRICARNIHKNIKDIQGLSIKTTITLQSYSFSAIPLCTDLKAYRMISFRMSL